MHDIPELDRSGLRQFGLTTGAVVAGLFGLLIPWLLNLNFPIWPWVIFAALAAWSLIAPTSLRLVYTGWMHIGLMIGAVMNRVVLSIVFYLVILPMGIGMRLAGKDPMMRKIDKSASTYRVKSQPPRTKNMERPF